MKTCLLSGLLLLALPAFALAAEQPPSLHPAGHFALQGDAATGALQSDADGKRLYVAHGNTLDVLASDTGSRAGGLSASGPIHALALCPEAKKLYAALPDSLIAIDTASLQAQPQPASLPEGSHPACLAYDADTGHLFVGDAHSGQVTVLEAATGKPVGMLSLGGEFTGAACDGYARFFVAARDRNLVHVVDTHALKSLGDYPTAPGVSPLGMALEDEGRRLFIPCANGKLVVLDNDVGAVFRMLKLEGDKPVAVAFGLADADAPVGNPPWKGRIVTAMADGTINVGRMMAFVNYVAYDHFKVDGSPRAVAIDGPTQRTYVLVATQSGAQVEVFEP